MGRLGRRDFLALGGAALASPFLPGPAFPGTPTGTPLHGLSAFGDLKYAAGFSHFDYLNPDAPKGGSVVYAAIGSFDSFNPYTIQGTPGPGASYETLLTSTLDEAFTEYGLIAETIEVPEDRSWVIFNLRKEARFHDGEAITADDVVFSFNLLKEKGPPFYQSYYSSVDKVEKLGDLRVKFSFVPGDNRELPLIVGQLPVLPEHLWKDKDITQPTLIIAGAEDAATTVAQNQFLAERIPNAEIKVYEDVGHFCQLERPLDFNADLRGLLARVAA